MSDPTNPNCVESGEFSYTRQGDRIATRGNLRVRPGTDPAALENRSLLHKHFPEFRIPAGYTRTATYGVDPDGLGVSFEFIDEPTPDGPMPAGV